MEEILLQNSSDWIFILKLFALPLPMKEEGGRFRHYGTIDYRTEAIEKVIKRLTATGDELRFVYEAGPCGFVLYRYLTNNGFKCILTFPGMIPPRKSVRIKNGCRDDLQNKLFIK